MLKLSFSSPDRPLRLLCIGAHSDDIEIGCGGTILEWLSTYSDVEVTWVVLSAANERAAEASNSANALLRQAKQRNIMLRQFRDGYFPSQFFEVKTFFEEIRRYGDPDVIFTHCLQDRHQDHRLVSELTWQAFRDHLILEYEIPKYEGDLGHPNLFVPLSRRISEGKVEHLTRYFDSQRSKTWFRSEVFLGLMQLRGIECRAASNYAEAFHSRKVLL